MPSLATPPNLISFCDHAESDGYVLQSRFSHQDTRVCYIGLPCLQVGGASDAHSRQQLFQLCLHNRRAFCEYSYREDDCSSTYART